MRPPGLLRRIAASAARRAGAIKRAMYRGGRPGPLMRLWNRVDAWAYSTGRVYPDHAAVLMVRGRHTGKVSAVPIAIADLAGEEFVVSMLGPNAQWVRNVEAAGGGAVLRRRGRDIRVRLEVVPVPDRATVLRRYVAIAPGARPHLGLAPSDPLSRFREIAHAHPVFRIRMSA
ncbi:hypothetical protein [Thermasporomyces composti]|uniref:Deazaflavin-dependent oxidoreductase (Nitroreductase family) n=1 Tax=Thermasporomyces composti TaxID=696763 RepID=A0A3D9V9B9_THECX|nr:hypothetical protein [Thermasporomyces composti]REF38378.1 hypothetical protein DFJ64_3856 [Thermasporomyces composti]